MPPVQIVSPVVKVSVRLRYAPGFPPVGTVTAEPVDVPGPGVTTVGSSVTNEKDDQEVKSPSETSTPACATDIEATNAATIAIIAAFFTHLFPLYLISIDLPPHPSTSKAPLFISPRR